MLTHGSLFTGIGGFDLGFDRSGIETVWQAETNSNCNKVLARRWPDVERFNDVRNCGRYNLRPVDVITGGFPCQDLSIAGKRKGLAGKRSRLWFEFHRILEELRPQWVVAENVPGLLSSNGGRDFAIILSGLAEIGYGVCWRILDAQYFGVAQRRRRVFIIGSLGSGRSAEVLFESQGVSRDIEKGRKKKQEVAKGTIYCIDQGGGKGQSRYLIGQAPPLLESMTSHAIVASKSNLTRWNQAFTVSTGQDQKVLAFDWQQGAGSSKDVTATLNVTRTQAVCLRSSVRRLTPTECERLQGFPDGWTAGHSDTARYKMLGNAVCVPKAQWIGKRIKEASAQG